MACGPRAYPITRTTDGEVREGIFVSPYAYEAFMRAELAVARGNDDAALAAYEQARTGPVDDPYVISRQASALIRLGRYDDAQALLAQGRELDARSEALALSEGELRFAQGDENGAVEAWRRAHDFAPSSDEPVRRVVAVLDRTPSAADALEAMTRGSDRPVALRARLALALHRGNAELAGESANALMRVAPVFRTELAELAEAQLRASRPTLALRLLAHPAMHIPEVLSLRVRALVDAGEQASARNAVVAEGSARPPLERARLWLIVGEAQLAYDDALAARAHSGAEASFLAGEAAMALDEPARAAQHYSDVPAASPRAEEARARLREALTAAGLEELGGEI